MKLNKNKGISVLEIIIVISVISILAALVIPGLSRFKKEQTLRNGAADIVSLLNKAHSDTISSLNSNVYGVHFETNRIVYFAGAYDTNDIISEIIFDSSIIIPSSGGINLNGGGNEVTFNRLTGETANYGTIIVRLASDSTRQKTITISKTGSVSSN